MRIGISKTKILCTVLALILICSLLTACGEPENLTQDFAIGIWKAEYNENGSKITSSVALNGIGEYGWVIQQGDDVQRAEIGTYEIDGNSVILYKSGETFEGEVFTYSGGRLVKDGHKYIKEKAAE